MQIQSIWPAELDLGEGPVWHAASGRFFFVDVHGCAVHAWSPASGQRQSWKMPERIGWLIPRANGEGEEGGFVAGFQSGFAKLWLEPTVRIEAIGCPHPGQPDVRLNDAKADSQGRIWAGSMNNLNPAQPDGQLTRLDPSGTFTVLERRIHIANGPCISADGHRMLHTDSWLNTVYSYRIGPAGDLTDKQVWRKFPLDEGTPDGMTMDTEGHVWIAFWGGACVRQFTADGKLLQHIGLPALQVTSIAFGGDNLATMLVTSARTGLNEAQLKEYPQSGAVFTLQPGATGMLPQCYGA